jgi:hypothetical protein
VSEKNAVSVAKHAANENASVSLKRLLLRYDPRRIVVALMPPQMLRARPKMRKHDVSVAKSVVSGVPWLRSPLPPPRIRIVSVAALPAAPRNTTPRRPS